MKASTLLLCTIFCTVGFAAWDETPLVVVNYDIPNKDTFDTSHRQAFVLSAESDVYSSVGKILEAFPNVVNLHLVSHGAAGVLFFGSTVVNVHSLQAHSEVLSKWNSNNRPLRIHLYGCNVAQGLSGQQFVDALASITQSQVFSSNDLTGYHGNWNLEISSGKEFAKASLPFSLEKLTSFPIHLASQVSFGNVQSSNSKITSFDVTFSSAVSGVQLRQFSLLDSTGTPLSLSGTTITGSGTTYTVSNTNGIVSTPGNYSVQFRNDPPSFCTSPIQLVDVSNPTTVVGTGTAASCTEAAYAAAIKIGGIITFNCGASPVTITLTSVKNVTLTTNTTIDGGGLVTLSGGGTTRILAIETTYDKKLPLVTVQNLVFTNGRTTDVTNTGATNTGGACMYRLGGAFNIINCDFYDSNGPVTGQDVAGGAVYSVGGGSTIIVNSIFTRNKCSNGGAIGNLGNNFTMVNSYVTANVATGNGGNPGNGGNGGGISFDGQTVNTNICGSSINYNKGAAFGGGIFRVGYTQSDSVVIKDSNFNGNNIPGSPSQGCGVYLQGMSVTMTSTLIAKNNGSYASGMYLGPDAKVALTDVTVAYNTASGLAGAMAIDSSVSGTFTRVTILNNTDLFAALAGGAGITLKNSVIAYNYATNGYNPISCQTAFVSGGNNWQYPITRTGGDQDSLCATGTQTTDPKMGPLQDNGCTTLTAAPLAGSPVSGAGATCTNKNSPIPTAVTFNSDNSVVSRGPFTFLFTLDSNGTASSGSTTGTGTSTTGPVTTAGSSSTDSGSSTDASTTDGTTGENTANSIGISLFVLLIVQVLVVL